MVGPDRGPVHRGACCHRRQARRHRQPGPARLGHVLGANGFVTHLSNFWPEYPLSIWRALESRDYEAVPAILARFKWAWSGWAGRVASISGGEGPFIKAAMELAGFQVGPPRPPAVRPTPALMAELAELFDRAELPRLGSPVVAVPA